MAKDSKVKPLSDDEITAVREIISQNHANPGVPTAGKIHQLNRAKADEVNGKPVPEGESK